MCYIIITPVRNEEKYIEKTILSMINQSIHPLLWVLVNDLSTDNTENILLKYEKQYRFIKLIQNKGYKSRSLGSQISAFNMGYSYAKNIDFQYIGKLDADVSIPRNYYELVINKLRIEPKLGIAGGTIYEMHKGRFKSRNGNRTDSVPGAIQLFRKQCFHDIGGFIENKYGGYDSVAEEMARMKGWQVRSYEQIIARHYRKTGMAEKGIIKAKIFQGFKDYSIGYIPMYEILKCIKRVKEKPIIIGSFFRFVGYFWLMIKRENIAISAHVLKYIRDSQKKKICKFIKIKGK